MRRIRVFFVVVSVLLLLAVPASAQDYPKVEIFGGISYANVDDTIDMEREQFFGLQTSFAGNLNESFGIVGDIGAQEGWAGDTYEFMAGPRFAWRGDTATGFVHAMFGGATFRGDFNSDTGFAMAFGGGLDVNVGGRLVLRAFQFDYVPTRLFNTRQHNIRLGLGVVFKLGGG